MAKPQPLLHRLCMWGQVQKRQVSYLGQLSNMHCLHAFRETRSKFKQPSTSSSAENADLWRRQQQNDGLFNMQLLLRGRNSAPQPPASPQDWHTVPAWGSGHLMMSKTACFLRAADSKDLAILLWTSRGSQNSYFCYHELHFLTKYQGIKLPLKLLDKPAFNYIPLQFI